MEERNCFLETYQEQDRVVQDREWETGREDGIDQVEEEEGGYRGEKTKVQTGKSKGQLPQNADFF